ncbi:MAG: ArsR/SmtB family transcription factor [Aestuariivirgaceae bacterium]
MTPNTQGAFRALADPTRRQILMHLSIHDMTIGEVVDQFDITRAAVRKHLTILEQGALISVHAKGRERINRLEPLGLKSAADWLGHFDRFWDDRLADLQTAIENHNEANDV